MEESKAIKHLRTHIEYLRHAWKPHPDYNALESIVTAIMALEKQVQEKPYVESDGDADGYPVWDYYCPSCNEYFDEYQPKYCWKCGQAIDWSEID